VARARDGHGVFLHRFEQRALRLGGGAVDLVGEHDLGEDGPAVQFEASGGPTGHIHHQHVRSGDVSGHQIRRELDAGEVQIEARGEGSYEQGFPQAWRAFEQNVPAGDQSPQHLVDGCLLAVAAIFVVAPLAAIVAAGLAGPLAEVLQSAALWRATLRSLFVGLGGGLLATGLATALLITTRDLKYRHWRPRLAERLELLGSLNLVVSPTVLGAGLFVLLLPLTVANFSGGQGPEWLSTVNALLGRGQPLFLVIYVSLIVFFAFFYTAIVFNPQETADNLRQYGGFIPGIRPGKNTADYLDYVLTRLTVLGAIYLSVICIIPEWLIAQFSVPFYFGGTSLLIVVTVTMDTVGQVHAHLLAHQYEGLIKKSRLRGRRG